MSRHYYNTTTTSTGYYTATTAGTTNMNLYYHDPVVQSLDGANSFRFHSQRVLLVGDFFQSDGRVFRVVGTAAGGACEGLCERVFRPDQNFVSKMERQGYEYVKMFEDGVYAAILKMIFTYNIVYGLDESGWKRTYFYETELEAIAALSCWDGAGYPPGAWIKEKPSDRCGPGAKEPNYPKAWG